MQQNETVLTPIYRYIISTIEANGLNNIQKSVEEICNFQKHFEQDTQKGTEWEADFKLLRLDKIERLLAEYQKDKAAAGRFCDEQLREVEREECNNCLYCLQCRSYLWHELREVLFGIENEMRQEGVYLPLRVMPEEISRHFEPSIGISDMYDTQNYMRHRQLLNCLVLLKGMSSSTPSLLNSIFDTEQFDGGGFFLRWQDCGIAVDPGYHFIHNLHHYGLSVLDIDVVIITHEHIDHNSDMRLLDDIHYTVSNEGKSHRIIWFLDKLSFQMAKVLQDGETGFNVEANDLFCVNPEDDTYDIGKGTQFRVDEFEFCNHSQIRLHTFVTKHIKSKRTGEYFKHTYGCAFTLSDQALVRKIVYIADTCYFSELDREVADADIVIANISGIYEDDYMLVKKKERHLGYLGCYHLLEACHQTKMAAPTYFLLSEFWNGKSDIRFDVSRDLQKRFTSVPEENNVRVIPAEVGMTLDVVQMKFRCSQCNQFTDEFKVLKPIELGDKVRIICHNCLY